MKITITSIMAVGLLIGVMFLYKFTDSNKPYHSSQSHLDDVVIKNDLESDKRDLNLSSEDIALTEVYPESDINVEIDWDEKSKYVDDLESMADFFTDIQSLNSVQHQRVLIRALFKRLAHEDTELISLYLSSDIAHSTESFTNLVKREGKLQLSELVTFDIDTEGLLANMITYGVDLETVTSIYRKWIELEPLSALDWLEQYASDTHYYGELVPQALYAVIESQPEVAIERINLLRSHKEYQGLMQKYAEVTGNQDPYAAMVWAMAQDSPLSLDLQYIILSQWAGKSPTEAAAFIQSQPIEQQQRLMQISGFDMVEFGIVDPVTTMTSNDLPEVLDEFIKEKTMLEWISNDPDAAVSWLRRSGHEQGAFDGLLNDLPRANLQASQEIYPSLAKTYQKEMIEGLVREMALVDEEDASLWLDSNVTDMELRLIADTALFGTVAESNPQRALDMAHNSNHDTQAKSNILEKLALQIRESKPEAIEQWIQSNNLVDEERDILRSVIYPTE
jgi:hypothetical protein